MCSSVLLPEPDGPMIASSSPRGTSRSTPRRARTSVSPSPKVLLRLRTRTAYFWASRDMVRTYARGVLAESGFRDVVGAAMARLSSRGSTDADASRQHLLVATQRVLNSE